MPLRAIALAAALLGLFGLVLTLHVREVHRTGLAQPPVFAVPGPADDPVPRVGGLRLERGAGWDGLERGDRLLRLGDVDLRGVGHVGFDAIALEQAGASLETTVTYERDGVERTAVLRMRPYPVPWFRIPLALSWMAAALVVLAAAPRSRDSQLFAATFATFSIFMLPVLGGPRAQTYLHHTLFFLGGPLSIGLGLLWMLRFPPELRPEQRLPAALAGVAALHLLVRLGYLFGGPIPPAAVPGFAIAADVLFLLVGLGILAWNYAHANPIGRRRLKWILYAIGVWGAVALAAAAVPVYGRTFGGFAFPDMMLATVTTMALIPLGVVVSLLRHNLLDIDRVMVRSAAFGLTFVAASALALALVPRISGWITAASGLAEGVELALFAGLLAVVVPAGRAIEPLLERLFLRARLRAERDLHQLLRDLAECRTPEELLRLVAARLAEILRPESTRLFVADGDRFAPAAHAPDAESRMAPGFRAAGALPRALERRPLPLLATPRSLASEVPDLSDRERAQLASLGAELLLPLRAGKDLAAFVVLGPKQSGDLYTQTELSLLQTLGERAGAELRRLEGDDELRRERERARELARLRREADEANLEKTRFMAAASHDLRQPLHALGLFAQTLAEQVDDPAAQATIAKLEASANALRDMLTKLLDLSRLEAGGVQPEITSFDAAALLARVAAEHAGAAHAKGLALHVEPSTAPVQSDPMLLGRIVANLVSNAVRYTDTGSVTLRTRQRGPRVQIEVADTGPGIPESERVRIFEAFVRLGERKVEDGLGLGLSIVERLARLLGCELVLRSEIGVGSTFAISVPFASDVGAEARNARPTASIATDLAGRTLVVIDDDRAVLEAMQTLLARWGCEVVSGADAESALATLAARGLRPDAVLADFRLLGRATGLDAIARIRAVFGRAIPAAVITGETTAATRDAIRAAGLHSLTKPVPPHKLRALLRELVRS